MKKLLLTSFFGCAIIFSAQAQVIKIKELNSDNELIEITKPHIVDINSMLNISIDKSALLDSMSVSLGDHEYPSVMLKTINYALRLQQQTMASVVATGSRNERLKALDNFRQGMSGIFIYLVEHQSELSGTQFYQDLTAKADPSVVATEGYKPFFIVLNNYYEQVTNKYSEIVSNSSARFKLGGWLNTSKGPKQFHIDGFDSLTSTGIVEIPRFITSVPASEVAVYNQARVLADSLKNNADDLLIQMKSRAESSLDQLEGKIDDILKSGITGFESKVDSLSNAVRQPFVQPVSQLKQSLNDFKVDLVRLSADVKSLTFSSALATTQQTQATITKAENLKNQAENLYQLLNDQVLQVPAIAQNIKTGLTADITNVLAQLQGLGESYLSELQSTLKTFDEGALGELSETAAKFTANTFSLSYNSIPSEADLDLRTIGQREPGDQIYFKAVILNDSTGKAFNKTLFWKKYTMFHIGIHNSIRASLIFANKINGDFANATNDFQLAPSYSVLFKVGTRKGMFYNKYLTPALGVNVSTLDFDNDNTPEIGIGLTAAFFKDYLQVGYGRNMASDDNFWMFGLRLPLFGWATGVETTTASSTAISN